MDEVTAHQHGEAFNLMVYRSDDGTEEEVIWNSRDGVTPLVITLRSGKQATHVDWHRDRYAPEHQPQPGDRIFVDLAEEKARQYARANAEKFWNMGEVMGTYASDVYESVDQLAEELAASYLERPGAPDLIEVTGEPL